MSDSESRVNQQDIDHSGASSMVSRIAQRATSTISSNSFPRSATSISSWLIAACTYYGAVGRLDEREVTRVIAASAGLARCSWTAARMTVRTSCPAGIPWRGVGSGMHPPRDHSA